MEAISVLPSDRIAIVVVVLLTSMLAPIAVAADSMSEDDSRHRLDFSYIAVDSRSYDSSVWGFGYAYSLTPKTNLAVSVPLLDPSFERDHDSGFGDTTVSWSWSPRQVVSVRPWVPRQVGTGLEVTLPTGNAAKGRGLDATLLTPFLGLAVPMNDRITLLPTLGYTHSMGSTAQGTRIRFAAAELGINYLQESRWWATIYGAYLYDFEVHKTYWNYAASTGLLVTENWGGSIEFTRTQFFEPGVVALPTGAVDSQFSLNLHYNF